MKRAYLFALALLGFLAANVLRIEFPTAWAQVCAGPNYIAGVGIQIVSSVIGTKNVPTGVYNAVTDYGADPTGSTNTAAKIQNAYNAAYAAGIFGGGADSVPGVVLPSGSYKLEKPLILLAPTYQPYLKGDGYQQTNLRAYFMGPAVVTANIYAANFGVSTTTGAFAATNAMLWSSTANGVIDLNQIQRIDTSSSPRYTGPNNGLSHWDIRFFFRPDDVSTEHCVWFSDGAYNFVLNTSGMGYFCVNSSAHPIAGLKINGTVQALTSSGTTLSATTWYEGELNYDSTTGTANLYVGPTGGTVTRVAQATGLSGTITQRLDENNVLGAQLHNFPHSGAQNFWQGAIQSIQVSNVARHTGSSYSADTGNFSSDGNTLVLINNDISNFATVNGGTSPLVEVDMPSNGWVAVQGTGGGCCGGTYTISDLTIANATVGLLADATAVNARNLDFALGQEGLELIENATYQSQVEHIVADNSMLDVELDTGINRVSDLNLSGQSFNLVTQSTVKHGYISTSTTTYCPVLVPFSEVGAITTGIDDWNWDSEVGGTFPAACVSNIGTTVFTRSTLEPGNAADVQLIGNPGAVALRDSVLSYTGSVVDATYATVLDPGYAFIFDGDVYDTVPVTYISPNSWPYVVEGINNLTLYPQVTSLTEVTSAYSATSLPTLRRPATSVTGSLDVVLLTFNASPGTITMSGWTHIAACDVSSSSNVYQYAYYRVATASSGSVAPSWANTANAAGMMLTVNNYNSGTPIDTCFTGTAASGAGVTVTGGSAYDANDLVVFAGSEPNVGPVTAVSPPSGTFSLGGANVLAFAAWAYNPASSTIPSVTIDGVTTYGMTGIQLAIRAND